MEMQTLDYKAVPIGGVEDDGAGVVEALVAVTGIKDRVNDIILPGAFQKSLAARTPKGVWHHNIHESIARTVQIKELAPGDEGLPKQLPDGSPWPAEAGALKVKMEFNMNTQRGRDAYEDVKFFGTDQEWSIGYSVPTGGATIDRKSGGVRKISTLDLYEYSPVLFGAMPNARTVSVKSAQEANKVLLGLNTDEGRELKALWDELVADEVKAAKKKRTAGNDEEETEESEQDSEKTPATEGPDKEDETTDSEEDDSEDAWEDDDSEEEEKPKKRKGTKSIELDANGIDLLDTAVKALTALRDHVVDGVINEAKADTNSGDESLSSLVDSAGLDVADAASAFDQAVSDNDEQAMEDAGNTILDAVDAAKDAEDADTGALKKVTAYIASAFENVAPEEPAEEETKSKSATKEKDEDEDSETTDDAETEEEEDEEKSDSEVVRMDMKALYEQFGLEVK
ncbi:capsid maturation protease [Gordonia phage Kabocha]|nr:capsid maturation protease [Gordonia phage Kabocha]WAA20012.1 capsid maturation protease [Gordonia phage Hanem]WNM67054.1 capsid maturation protease [Gordonia Phage Schomber]